MENNKLDQLFAKKLKEAPIAPSDQAWQKLNSKLNKKNSKTSIIWYAVAASITLFAITFLWLSDPITEETPAPLSYDSTANKKSNKNPSALKEIAAADPIDIKEPNASSEEQNSTTGIPSKVLPNNNNQDNNQLSITLKETHKSSTTKQTVTNTAPEQESVTTEKVNTEVVAATENNKEEITNGVSMTYQLGDYRKKKNTVQETDQQPKPEKEQTTEERKVSKLKKVLNFAKELKNGDSGLNGIKNAKDEFFDFGKKNKKKNSK